MATCAVIGQGVGRFDGFRLRHSGNAGAPSREERRQYRREERAHDRHRPRAGRSGREGPVRLKRSERRGVDEGVCPRGCEEAALK